MVEAVLRKAEFARTTNFDLLGVEGYALLAAEVAKDFPYLKLDELHGIVLEGIKGRLDKYSSQPVNFTRIYHWIDDQAAYQASYWANRSARWWRWVELTGLQSEALLNVSCREFLPNKMVELLQIVCALLAERPDIDAAAALAQLRETYPDFVEEYKNHFYRA